MPPLPKRKISSQRQGKRRAAQRINLPTLVRCQNCGQLKFPSYACPNCSPYKSLKKAKNEKSK